MESNLASSTESHTARATRAAAIFFAASGVLAIGFAIPVRHSGAITLGVIDLLIGAAIRLTPWHRLPGWATGVIVPVAFLVIGLFQLVNAQTEATYTAFFFITFLLAGLAYPPGSAFWLAPLAVVAYVLPLRLGGHPAEEIAAAGVVLPMCVVIAEVVARSIRALDAARSEAQAQSDRLRREVAEREQVEQAARRMAAIVESSEDAIVGWGLDERITSWNAAAERMYGYAAAEAVGQPLKLTIPDTHAGEVRGLLERLRRGEPVNAYETERRRKDGGLVSISLSLSPVRDAAGEIAGAAAIGRDITAQKRLEAEVREAQRMEAIGKLAGGLAHEFNNLLTVIGGNAFLVRSDLADDDPAAADVDHIIEATERAAELTRELLAFGRRQVLQPSDVDLNGVVRATEHFLRDTLGTGVELVTRLHPGGVHAYVDPGQIEQVLLGLAYRARDAMPQGGRLTVETSSCEPTPGGELPAGRYSALVVSDTGPALDEASRARIFEPFFLSEERGPGLALGLSIVQGIVHQSGGEIRVSSRPDAGTTFTVLLPPAPTPAAAASGQRESEAPRPPSSAVLVVDDDAAVRSFTSRVLRGAGYPVLEAEDGVSGLELWQERRAEIALVVADVEMPRMGGLEMTRRMRETDPAARVLFISGYADDAAVRDGAGLQQGSFLPKPFAPHALLQAAADRLEPRPG
jgi:two-component system, cell cycle sensor histidine kinase and response regulator CckA